jgi:hypothetical protein
MRRPWLPNRSKALAIWAEGSFGDTYLLVLKKFPTKEAGPAKPLKIPPFPAAQISRAIIEDLFSPFYLVDLPLAISQANAVQV